MRAEAACRRRPKGIERAGRSLVPEHSVENRSIEYVDQLIKRLETLATDG